MVPASSLGQARALTDFGVAGSVRSVEGEACPGEESAEDVVPVLQRLESPAEQSLQFAEGAGGQVGQAPLDVRPQALNWVEVGRIPRQQDHCQPFPLVHERFHRLGDVGAQPVPHHDHRGLQLAWSALPRIWTPTKVSPTLAVDSQVSWSPRAKAKRRPSPLRPCRMRSPPSVCVLLSSRCCRRLGRRCVLARVSCRGRCRSPRRRRSPSCWSGAVRRGPRWRWRPGRSTPVRRLP